MSNCVRRLIRSTTSTALIHLVFAAVAAAQQPLAQPPPAPAFMPRFDAHLTGVWLRTDDPRFQSGARFGGDFDLVDYQYGRITVGVDYEAVLGSEFRAFDLNQGIYTLVAGSSVRFGGTEVFGMIHHVSRHLSDRPKRRAIAWNDADVRVLQHISLGDATVDINAGMGKVLDRSFVDYQWTADGEIVVRDRVSSIATLFAKAVGQAIGIDPTESSRGRQIGYHLEAGIRLGGGRAALEVFGGIERVIDADPFEQLALRWPFAGFRIVTR